MQLGIRPRLPAEIGNGEAVEGEKDQSKDDHDPDGKEVIDDREGKGVSFGYAEDTEAEDAEVMPVSDEAGRRGDGNSDDQDDHEDKGGHHRELEAEGEEKQIDCENDDKQDHDR